MAIGKTNSGSGAGVSGGYTLKVLDALDQDMYIFSSVPNGKIFDLSPYPTKTGEAFVGFTTVKNDLSTRVGFPVTMTNDMTFYPYFVGGSQCFISNLGSENPVSVTFSKTTTFPNENACFEEVVIDGNYFAKFYKWYKKPIFENGVLTGYSISNVKEDDDFKLYDCFYDEDGNELEYILLGQYRMSSTTTANSVDASAANMTISAGRALARAKGTGYQIMDCAMKLFWQDLALAVSENVDFNNGSGVASFLGLKLMNEGGWWIDGIAHDGSTYIYSNKPSKYVDQPATSTNGYSALSYSAPTGSNQCIKNLGYDANHPTISLPVELTGDSNWTSYYCDGYWYSSGNHPVCVYVGTASANLGLFTFLGRHDWSYANGVRLCYRPIGGN